LLGIARRKAGTETTCPHCGGTITVPMPDRPDDRTELAEIDALVNPASAAPAPLPAPLPVPAPASASAVATRPAAPPPSASSAPPAPRPVAPPPKPAPTPPVSDPTSLPESERPLFERDVDAVLGIQHKLDDELETAKPKPKTTAGMDAMSLGSEPGAIVLSSQTATALVVGVLLLLALAFAAGFLIGSL
jgi:hypothetical protein